MTSLSPSKTVGVILAGGSGQRFGGNTPKQFVKLAGKLVLEHTVEIFEQSPDVDEVIVVARADTVDTIWDLARKNHWSKLQKVVVGGADRFSSTHSAIECMRDQDGETSVLFHDAVRPLLSPEVIENCVKALTVFEAVDVVIPSSDTLVVVQDNGCISNIPSRAQMRRGQTPQGFKLKTIREAYARANKLGQREFTCDCGVVRAMLPHIAVATVPGSETNIKITNPLDLFLAEKLIQSNDSSLSLAEHGLSELAGKNIVVFGGSSGIGKSIHDLAVLNRARVWVAGRSTNAVDVGRFEDVAAFLDKVAAEAGQIDAVVNSAGLLIKKPIMTMKPEEIASLIRTNYEGAVNTALAAKPHLTRSRGVLLNFTSSSYTRGRAQYAIYSSTKCAVVNLTQALAEEWVEDDVRVNCINPERTRTPMRTSNFGYEDPVTLLDPESVAVSSLKAILSQRTGMIIDVRKDGRMA